MSLADQLKDQVPVESNASDGNKFVVVQLPSCCRNLTESDAQSIEDIDMWLINNGYELMHFLRFKMGAMCKKLPQKS